MSSSSRPKEVRFLSDKPTSSWGLGGWSLMLLTLAVGLGVYGLYRTRSGMACLYNLCTEQFTAHDSTVLLIIAISGLICWLGSIFLGIFGCITRSNTLAAGLALFLSLVPTVYIVLELLHTLFSGLLASG